MAREDQVRELSRVILVLVLADLALLSGALYLLPVLVGWIRRAPHLGSVAAVNMLLGWTIIGWAAALAMVLQPADDASAPARIPWSRSGSPQPPCPPEGRVAAGRHTLRPRRDRSPPPLKLPPAPAGPGTAS